MKPVGRSLLAAALLAAILAGLWFFFVEWGAPEIDLRAGRSVETSAPREADELAPPQPVARAQVAVAEPAAAEQSEAAQAGHDARTIRLILFDRENDRPVEGARVETFQGSIPAVATTDASGSCAVQARTDADSIRMAIERAGYFHVRGDFMIGP